MLSRVAENLYWLARYIERAENTARIVNVNANLLLDLPKGIAPGWAPLVDITGASALFEEHYKEYGERQVMRFLLGDERHPGSILSALNAARENCRTIRDFVPREAWEEINSVSLFAREGLQRGLTKNGRHAYLRGLISRAQLISGLLDGTMLHDQGFEFLTLGRYLERADMTTRIADVQTATLVQEADEIRPYENIQLVSVLKSMTAYQMYRRSAQIRVQRGPVLKFIFKSQRFPRSLRWCVDHTRICVERLPRNEACLRVNGRLARALDASEPERFSKRDLHQFIDELQLDIAALHGEVTQTWFPPVLSSAA